MRGQQVVAGHRQPQAAGADEGGVGRADQHQRGVGEMTVRQVSATPSEPVRPKPTWRPSWPRRSLGVGEQDLGRQQQEHQQRERAADDQQDEQHRPVDLGHVALGVLELLGDVHHRLDARGAEDDVADAGEQQRRADQRQARQEAAVVPDAPGSPAIGAPAP
jgi:hypothetical protein